ncbi:replication-associated recombination protein A [candidate division WWE3 bacterium]|uniref:Replication-associated recombination protein A n=1 Tax=candidate division WWE3 bacterium TaxID=2053526 RepID=A0A3A4ZBH2_UNCKA|nr:MAG: replication-associated recombination protein A [candidate division WWE3 bacterium]
MPNKPLAEILRPAKLQDFVGQTHLTGESGLITKILAGSKKTGFFPSIVLWGPPGCGKTTLARILSSELNRDFYEFSAVNSSVKDIEKIIPKKSAFKKQKELISVEDPEKKATLSPIVFIDEIHRFNKAQQDALLPFVEQGTIIFIGATTENPSFEVISPLLSRTRVLILNQLTKEDLEKIIDKGLQSISKEMDADSKDYLVEASNGDARICINVLEIASNISTKDKITLENIKDAFQNKSLMFDLRGEEYYNTISALHKSIRASDPDASLYWLARMLEAGQDPLYIARRLIRVASEDIGISDPQALIIATSCFYACNTLGMPECNLALSETVVYLSKAPKSNKLYIAYSKAAEDVKKHGNLPVPLHIRNPVTKMMKEIGYGKGYNYHHSPEGEKLEEENYFPEELRGTKYLN